MVLYQEPSGGSIPAVYQKKAREAGELVVGSLQSVEQARGHRGRASEASAARPRQATGVLHLLLPSGRPAGGEEVADVELLGPNRSRPHIAGGVGEGRGLESA